MSQLREEDSVSSRGNLILDHHLSESRIPFHTQAVTSFEEKLGKRLLMFCVVDPPVRESGH